ncbi:MAG: hypothetical protein SV375_11255 [Thermodesulfobacteriota bacterium]|nr:hypothetical protein [Thermodesulfobacteriota bacterium]
MKIIKNIIGYAILIAFLVCALSSIRVFWDKYNIEKDLEAAAIYGTKHSVEDTFSFLLTKMKEEERDFKRDDFIIEKNSKNTVFISLTYEDAIYLFSIKLKEFEFTIKVKARDIKAFL